MVAVTFTWDSDGNWYLSGGLAPRTPSVSLNFGVIDDPSTKPKTFLKGYALNANVSIGIVGGGLLIFFAQTIGSKLYGDQYSSLAALMPLFAALLCLRYIETACGLLLVARGKSVA